MKADEIKPSEEALKKALASLAINTLSSFISSYLTRSAAQNITVKDDINEEELAQLQVILIKEASREVGLEFEKDFEKDIPKYKENLKQRIFEKAEIAEDRLKELVCDELRYCEKVGDNWRGKLLFGSGLALVALLTDLTGISVAGILYLLSTGYFDELCECNKGKAKEV